MAEHAEKKRRDRGDDGISWDNTNKCFVGTISLGTDPSGKRIRRTVTGKTKGRSRPSSTSYTTRSRPVSGPGDLHGGAVRQRLARLAHER